MSGEIPLQIDLFTGEKVDNRTRQQKQLDAERERPKQVAMFSQRDIAQIGVSAHPVMSLSPGRLVLVSEDLRTEEEIEADRLRQAQALTAPLFTEAVPAKRDAAESLSVELTSSETISSETEATDEINAEEDTPTPASSDTPATKYQVYLALVNAAQERAETVYHTPVSTLAETITMSKAKLDARLAGLTGDEIATALTIGDFRGKMKPQNDQPANSHNPENRPAKTSIPILWTNRDDMLKRRPDLADKIKTLRDDEIQDLGGLIGQSLEELYWIQLNFVLSLYLDHELRLRKMTKHTQTSKSVSALPIQSNFVPKLPSTEVQVD